MDPYAKGEQDGALVHDPPRRVLTRLPGTVLCISDYLYPGEAGEDALESIQVGLISVSSKIHVY